MDARTIKVSPKTPNISIGPEVDMSKLIEELMREIKPDIPEDAVTRNKLIAAGATTWQARQKLKEIEELGWNKVWYRGEYFYWKSAD